MSVDENDSNETTSTTTTSTAITIGGDKGHVVEQVDDAIFLKIYHAYRWKMIPNCTGRYTCRDHKIVSKLTPCEVLASVGTAIHIVDALEKYEYAFQEERRKDPIIVIPFTEEKETGLITYIKCESEAGNVEEELAHDDGIKYVHTLNSSSGFQRKLEAINVKLTDDHRLQD